MHATDTHTYIHIYIYLLYICICICIFSVIVAGQPAAAVPSANDSLTWLPLPYSTLSNPSPNPFAPPLHLLCSSSSGNGAAVVVSYVGQKLV